MGIQRIGKHMMTAEFIQELTALTQGLDNANTEISSTKTELGTAQTDIINIKDTLENGALATISVGTTPNATQTDFWYNPSTGVLSIWNGTAWGELSMNSPKGTVNFNTHNARLVIPVGVDKWAT